MLRNVTNRVWVGTNQRPRSSLRRANAARWDCTCSAASHGGAGRQAAAMVAGAVRSAQPDAGERGRGQLTEPSGVGGSEGTGRGEAAREGDRGDGVARSGRQEPFAGHSQSPTSHPFARPTSSCGRWRGPERASAGRASPRRSGRACRRCPASADWPRCGRQGRSAGARASGTPGPATVTHGVGSCGPSAGRVRAAPGPWIRAWHEQRRFRRVAGIDGNRRGGAGHEPDVTDAYRCGSMPEGLAVGEGLVAIHGRHHRPLGFRERVEVMADHGGRVTEGQSRKQRRDGCQAWRLRCGVVGSRPSPGRGGGSVPSRSIAVVGVRID